MGWFFGVFLSALTFTVHSPLLAVEKGMALVPIGGDTILFDRTEVSVAEFRKFLVDYAPQMYKDSNMPATEVSYILAEAYCESQGKRLPTSSEWRLACFGPEGWMHSNVAQFELDMARVGHTNWTDGPKAVGSYPASPWGLHDMVGNVWEWADGMGEPSKMNYVHGGSWVDGASRARCTKRLRVSVKKTAINYGFRCVRTVERETSEEKGGG